VFTSVNAVESFMGRLLAIGDIRDLKGVGLCAIGESTAQRMSRYGVRVDLTPDEARSEAVVDALKAAGDLKGKTFLLPRADIAREILADQLREAGAVVTAAAADPPLLAGTAPETHQTA